MCRQGLKLLGSFQNDAPREELIWMNGLIDLEENDIPTARQSLKLLNEILEINNINYQNYKQPVFSKRLALFSRQRSETAGDHSSNQIKQILHPPPCLPQIFFSNLSI